MSEFKLMPWQQRLLDNPKAKVFLTGPEYELARRRADRRLKAEIAACCEALAPKGAERWLTQ